TCCPHRSRSSHLASLGIGKTKRRRNRLRTTGGGIGSLVLLQTTAPASDMSTASTPQNPRAKPRRKKSPQTNEESECKLDVATTRPRERRSGQARRNRVLPRRRTVQRMSSYFLLSRFKLRPFWSREDVMEDDGQQSQQCDYQADRLCQPFPVRVAERYPRIGRQTAVQLGVFGVVKNVNAMRSAD